MLWATRPEGQKGDAMTAQNTPAPPRFAVSTWATGEDEGACRAAALYLVGRVPAPTFEKLAALLYLADRLHLSRYGALMFGGTYEALRDGPAPSALLRVARAGLDWGGVPDLGELSPAVLEVLEDVAAHYGQEDPAQVSAHTRGEDWRAGEAGQPITAQDMARTLPNARAVLEHLEDPHP